MRTVSAWPAWMELGETVGAQGTERALAAGDNRVPGPPEEELPSVLEFPGGSLPTPTEPPSAEPPPARPNGPLSWAYWARRRS